MRLALERACSAAASRASSAAQTQRPPLALAIIVSIVACASSSSALAAGTGSGTAARTGTRTRAPSVPCAATSLSIERQGDLAAGHGQVDVREDAGIEQRAVQFAARVVDAVALAQRIQIVALPGMHLARERQRVQHLAHARASWRRLPRGRRASSASRKATSKAALWITSSAPRDERQQLLGDLREARLARRARCA